MAAGEKEVVAKRDSHRSTGTRRRPATRVDPKAREFLRDADLVRR